MFKYEHKRVLSKVNTLLQANKFYIFKNNECNKVLSQVDTLLHSLFFYDFLKIERNKVSTQIIIKITKINKLIKK